MVNQQNRRICSAGNVSSVLKLHVLCSHSLQLQMTLNQADSFVSTFSPILCWTTVSAVMIPASVEESCSSTSQSERKSARTRLWNSSNKFLRVCDTFMNKALCIWILRSDTMPGKTLQQWTNTSSNTKIYFLNFQTLLLKIKILILHGHWTDYSNNLMSQLLHSQYS